MCKYVISKAITLYRYPCIAEIKINRVKKAAVRAQIMTVCKVL